MCGRWCENQTATRHGAIWDILGYCSCASYLGYSSYWGYSVIFKGCAAVGAKTKQLPATARFGISWVIAVVPVIWVTPVIGVIQLFLKDVRPLVRKPNSYPPRRDLGYPGLLQLCQLFGLLQLLGLFSYF